MTAANDSRRRRRRRGSCHIQEQNQRRSRSTVSRTQNARETRELSC